MATSTVKRLGGGDILYDNTGTSLPNNVQGALSNVNTKANTAVTSVNVVKPENKLFRCLAFTTNDTKTKVKLIFEKQPSYGYFTGIIFARYGVYLIGGGWGNSGVWASNTMYAIKLTTTGSISLITPTSDSEFIFQLGSWDSCVLYIINNEDDTVLGTISCTTFS